MVVISEFQLERENKKQRRERKREGGRGFGGGLSSDISSEIISRFTCSGDKVRFAAVCASWRLTAKFIRGRRPSHPPWLMLPGPQGKEDERRSLYSLSERHKLYHVHLPQIKGQRCVGSGQGWIVTVNNLTGDLQLLDLVSGGTHRLPSVTSFSDVGDAPVLDQQGCLKGYMYRPGPPTIKIDGLCNEVSTEFRFRHLSDMHSLYKKVIFFPSASLLFVFFNTPTILAFARLGDDSWKEFDKDCGCLNDVASSLTTNRIGTRGVYEHFLQHSYCCWFSDLVFHKGHFYVTLPPGWIMVLHLDSTPPRFTCLVLRPPSLLGRADVIESYLVESPDGTELMQVWRHTICYEDPYRTVSFTVFKCSNINGIGGGQEEEANWVEVKCLGEWVLFLGKNSSLALSTNDFPELTPNSIYFTRPQDDPRGHPNDMGVFNLETEIIEPLFFPDDESLLSHMTMPIWIPHTEYFPLPFAKVEEITNRSTIKYDDGKDQLVKDETNEHETCHSPTGSVLECVGQEWIHHRPPRNFCNVGSGKLRGAFGI